MRYRLRMTAQHHKQLRDHLLPIDGKEAIAFALCGRRADSAGHDLLVRKILLIPYEDCYERARDLIRWKTEALEPLLEEAVNAGGGILKIHSHPTGYARFSAQDDRADNELFSSVYGWLDDDLPHMSAVMLPSGQMFGRAIDPELQFQPLNSIMVVGDDIDIWGDNSRGDLPEFLQSQLQAFGEGTTRLLRGLSVAIVGCSGTGSPTFAQLAHSGVRRLVLVDPDEIESRNLNRILYARADDVGKRKVEVLARATEELGLDIEVQPIHENLFHPRAVRAVASCDMVFGCMDGAEGRYLLNKLATYYLLPYFDIGVRLDADQNNGIEGLRGSVHYLQPGGSSLVSRGVISMEQVTAEGLRRTNPEEYDRRQREGYIHGVQEQRPAVMPVNMHYASLGILEMLARVHRYRDGDNSLFAWHGSCLSDVEPYFYSEPCPESCERLRNYIGRGDVFPLLDLPNLSE